MSANYAVQASGWLWAFSKPMDVTVLGIGIRSLNTPIRCYAHVLIPIHRYADRRVYADTLRRRALHTTAYAVTPTVVSMRRHC